MAEVSASREMSWFQQCFARPASIALAVMASLCFANLAHAFSDDFATDSTADYIQTVSGADSTFVHDAGSQRGLIETEDNQALTITRELTESTQSGTFAIDVSPTNFHPSAGVVTIQFVDDNDNFYRITNRTGSVGEVLKIVGGQTIAQQSFTSELTIGEDYRLVMSFNPQQVSVDGFGSRLLMETNGVAIDVESVQVQFAQLDGFIDDLSFNASDSTSAFSAMPPIPDAIDIATDDGKTFYALEVSGNLYQVNEYDIRGEATGNSVTLQPQAFLGTNQQTFVGLAFDGDNFHVLRNDLVSPLLGADRWSIVGFDFSGAFNGMQKVLGPLPFVVPSRQTYVGLSISDQGYVALRDDSSTGGGFNSVGFAEQDAEFNGFFQAAPGFDDLNNIAAFNQTPFQLLMDSGSGGLPDAPFIDGAIDMATDDGETFYALEASDNAYQINAYDATGVETGFSVILQPQAFLGTNQQTLVGLGFDGTNFHVLRNDLASPLLGADRWSVVGFDMTGAFNGEQRTFGPLPFVVPSQQTYVGLDVTDGAFLALRDDRSKGNDYNVVGFDRTSGGFNNFFESAGNVSPVRFLFANGENVDAPAPAPTVTLTQPVVNATVNTADVLVTFNTLAEANVFDGIQVRLDNTGPVSLAAGATAHTFTNVAGGARTVTVRLMNGDLPLDNDEATDTVAFTVNPPQSAPSANAGTNQEVTEGAVVNLLGSGSTDDTSIVSYFWQQTSGSAVLAFDSAAVNPSFTAPALASGSEVYTFSLEVTDNDGLTDTDTVAVTVYDSLATFIPGYTEDFSANNIAQFTQIPSGAAATLTYDAASERAFLQTADNQSLNLLRDLQGVGHTGVFTIDFSPTAAYPSAGRVDIRLLEDSSNYYTFSNSTNAGGDIRKFVDGVVTEQTTFENAFSVGQDYQLVISISPTEVTVQGFGSTVTMSISSGLVEVDTFQILFSQLDGFIDNIEWSPGANSSTNIAPQASAGLDKRTQTGDVVMLDGSASDLDGNIVSFGWNQISGPSAPINNNAIATPEITAPVVSETTDLVFELVAVDNQGAQSTPDRVNVKVYPINGQDVIDDFSSDTTGLYTIEQLAGSATITYSAADENLDVTTGDGGSVQITRNILPVKAGSLEMTVQTVQNHGSSGVITMIMSESADTFYEYETTSNFNRGHLRKVVGGTEVTRVDYTPDLPGRFRNQYLQDVAYRFKVYFDGDRFTVGGLPRVLSVSEPGGTQLDISSVQIRFTDQDALIDDFRFNEGLVQYIVAFGDSITEGQADDIVPDGRGYVPILEALINQGGSDHTVIFNEGIGGNNTLDAERRVDTVVESHPAASLVLVELGTNDSGDSINTPVATYKTRMQGMLDAFTAVGWQSIVARTHAIVNDATRDARVQAFNVAVDELIDENSLVGPPDFHCYFSNNPTLMPDGFHPNGQGYIDQASMWFSVVNTGLETCTP